ncbi:GspH/FimT family pseudopilin [Pseudomonas sp. ZM23]|uniref:Type II secretion system protein H n=1 Tax=Pseudomonas triclosanedens TaxID=2961893 RepID=A0ABY7A2V4_9PSED|nr:GspH/FimT family pseudopilin [Pseudomonas triclosanedens]MCP8463870.1 GspH/FimT family pseudopilin [Pseudomonas triclosanedens]MCP8468954.1 GspH/FimT family pseudopilin [Pseudomonas triclosanedens]MCP8475676.1 GspH/FimT family pseudopilin [Pseudomonas triclosanedens]WAI50610.1 GspH/FimT family pseudopilin [Pseudomonas triclosanedens]
MSRPKGSAGFTLIELMVTILLLVILAGFAVPNFTSLIRSNRVQSVADEFYSLLQYARTEAVTRGQQVTLTASSATTWQGALTVSTAATTLRRQGTEGFGQSNISITSGAATLAFRPNGSSTTAALACFAVCPTDTATPSCRIVQVQTSGRVLPPATGVCP